MRIESTDETARLHDAAARLGYAVATKDLAKYFPGSKVPTVRELDDARREARAACDAVPARESREIYSAAYDAGVAAATADLGCGEVTR